MVRSLVAGFGFAGVRGLGTSDVDVFVFFFFRFGGLKVPRVISSFNEICPTLASLKPKP